MTTMHAALAKAGLATAPVTPDTQPDLTRFVRETAKVVKREKLWDAGTVGIKVPADARLATAQIDDGPITFLLFGQTCKGGFVNLHVHAGDPKSFAGKRVVAKAEVWRKDHEDGRSFLYVDLRPVTDGSKPTHRLAVMDMVEGSPTWTRLATAFETPRPLRAAVVIVGHCENFV